MHSKGRVGRPTAWICFPGMILLALAISGCKCSRKSEKSLGQSVSSSFSDEVSMVLRDCRW
jgi:hypothetical protein